MAFSARQVHTILYRLPDADGSIDIHDAGQVLWAYARGPVAISLGGSLTPTGALARTLTACRSVEGGMTPSGALSRLLTAYRALEGEIIPAGELESLMTFIETVGGELSLMGALSARNPAWMLIDKRMKWMGEWNSTWSYGIDDVILYKRANGNEWHVFISKIGHNTGNTPTNSALAWRRLYQEPLL